MYPNPPIPMNNTGLVLHRATLYDMTGIDTLLDWVSDGDAALVEMARLMNREHEVETVLARLHRFIEMDMGGQIVQITGTRVMLLPPGCVGISGLEDEAFNDEAGWFWRGLMEEQVIEMPCPMCHDEDNLRMIAHVDEIPYFGEHTQVTVLCHSCGWRQTDFIPAEGRKPGGWT